MFLFKSRCTFFYLNFVSLEQFIKLNKMAGLKFALGMIPNTLKTESADDNLRKEHVDYIEYDKSDDLKHFLELETEVLSADFSSRKKEILSLKYKNSNEYQKEKEFLGLKKSKPIKNYFKVKDSQQLKDYNGLKASDTLSKYLDLEKFVNSDSLAKAKVDLPPKEFKTSDEAAKEKEYFSLKKSSQFKKHFNFENSAPYKEFLRIGESDVLNKLSELKEFVNSSSFKEKKEYLNLPGKKKYELSEEFKKETEYNTLKKSEKVVWYQKIKKKYPFTEIEKWDLAFEDKFDADKVDTKTWMTRYVNGDKLMDKPYVLADDLHAFADGKNLDISSGKLSILTKQEDVKGLYWSPVFGFSEKDFTYSSDMVSSAKSFSQKEGIFKAKVKLGKSGVTQAFSLMTDQMLPHVDVFKLENNKLFAGNFWKNGGKNGISKSMDKTGGGRYSNDFHVFSLEWGDGKMVWKINDLVFKVQSQGLPDSEMHLCFNSSLKETTKGRNLPSKMEIDWVRVYKKK